jgi:hypothetical protein
MDFFMDVPLQWLRRRAPVQLQVFMTAQQVVGAPEKCPAAGDIAYFAEASHPVLIGWSKPCDVLLNRPARLYIRASRCGSYPTSR